MAMMPPHMAMMQGQPGPAKPLFPSAIPTSSPGAAIVGADFKPISSGNSQKKYFFVLISNVILATISAPPTTNTLNNGDGSKVNTIATTGAASKIIHPAEDISLEEIRCRQHKYAKSIPPKMEEAASSSSSAASEVRLKLTINST